jgi:hypothetical protein
MLGMHRTSRALFNRRGTSRVAYSRPAHRLTRRAWRIEELEGRTLLSTWPVTTLDDSPAEGTLRWAITQANQPNTGDDTITFAPGLTGTITLDSALPDLSDPTGRIDIQGPGAASLTVARSSDPGTPGFRIFTVDAGANVTLDGLTIAGGSADEGGGIYNAGTLTIDSCTLGGNSARYEGGGISNYGSITITGSALRGNSAGEGAGGGIYNGGSATITGSTLSGNSAGVGGGIFNPGGGSVTITGSTLSGNSAIGFHVLFDYYYGVGGGIYNGGGVTITGSTLSGNSADYGYGRGGGIYNGGTATITGSTLSGNSAGSGGGIWNWGTVTATDSRLSGNSAGGSDYFGGGGGIYNSGGGSVTITDSTLSGNSADYSGGYSGGGGGGIYNSDGGSVTITGSTLSGNSSVYVGGGILNRGTATITGSTLSGNSAGVGGGISNGGTATITGSTLSGNSALYGGGGISNWGTATISGSTLSGNSALSSNSAIAWGGGGGISNYGSVTITGSTLSGNSAGEDFGGGISNFNGGTATITGSTLSGNSAGVGGGISNFNGGTVRLTDTIVANSPRGGDLAGTVAGTSNLIGDGSGGLDPATNLLGVDPMLGPLQDNGGPTWTMAPLPGSPAIDAGSNDLIPVGVGFDQRGPGFQRIVNGTVDIGAVEWQSYVSSFVASWGHQTAPLKLAADGLRLLPVGRKTDLPWQDVKQLTITLSTAEPLTPDDITVSSTSGTKYGPVTLSGSGTSYTIKLAQPIAQADRVTIKLNLGGLVSPTFELDVLPGDVNDDGIVNAQDMVLIRNAIQKTGDPLMIGWADIDGDGVLVNDYIVARKKLGSRLR